MISKNDLYFCYSKNLFKFLKVGNGVSFICTGLHEKTLQQFWLFERSVELHELLRQYNLGSIEKESTE